MFPIYDFHHDIFIIILLTSINNSNNKTNSRKRTTPSSVKLNNRKSNTYDNCRNRYVENVLPFWCNDIPTKDEVEDTRAIHAIMMAELFCVYA